MKTERELFEKLPEIRKIMNENGIYFMNHSGWYEARDFKDFEHEQYINGAWYSWQARVPEGYVVVPVEPSDFMKCTVRDFGPDTEDYENMSKWDWEKLCGEIYKAMLEAVEK